MMCSSEIILKMSENIKENTLKSSRPPVFCAFGCMDVCCSFTSYPYECICCDKYDHSKYKTKVKNTSCCYGNCLSNGNVGFLCFGWYACDILTFPFMSNSKTCVPINCLWRMC